MRSGSSAAVALAVAGCAGPPAALDPAGPPASRIADLWWLFLAVCVIVMLATTVALVLAVLAGRRRARREPVLGPPGADPRRDRRADLAVAGATGLTVVTLLALLTASVLTGRALSNPGLLDRPIVIELVAHQWWWQVTYLDREPGRRVVTANEIHLPVGQPVKITLASQDVIHSFWVPQLHGKRDLVPGHHGEIWIQAGRPGVYDGQCAEFCGLQHARMRLKVFAEEPQRFAAWLEGQRQPAPEPATTAQRQGRDVFVGGSCALCHTVQGTDARGTTGPDLTHIAGRTTLAAGTLPNTPGHLATWITDPQAVKPGTRMPASRIDAESLPALLAWLGSLR
jgi:cytochrome c oxidase subunit 2